MAEFAQRIVAENGLDSAHSGPISVLPGRIEDLESLPVPQVRRHACAGPQAMAAAVLPTR